MSPGCTASKQYHVFAGKRNCYQRRQRRQLHINEIISKVAKRYIFFIIHPLLFYSCLQVIKPPLNARLMLSRGGWEEEVGKGDNFTLMELAEGRVRLVNDGPPDTSMGGW